MGGSNGGGGGFTFPSSQNYQVDENSCLRLSFKTFLASADADVLASVAIGEVYDVIAEDEKGPVSVIVQGKRLGTILHEKDVQLLSCIFEGTDYQAKIILIDGGKCQVSISAKR